MRIAPGLLVGLLLLACAFTPHVVFTREKAIRQATELARSSAPELGIQRARVDDVTAELITRAELRRRQQAEVPGEDPNSLIWWIEVRGSFQYESMALPGGTAQMCEADRRIFSFDADTGEEEGSSIACTRILATASPPRTPTPN